MNNYLQNFDVKTIDTHIALTGQDCKSFFIRDDCFDFKILHKNIRSLNKNFDKLLVLIKEINEDFHCIVLTETWQLHNLDIYNIPGYQIVYNNGTINQNDGVVIFIKESLNFSCDVVSMGTFKFLQVVLKHLNKNIMITGIYRPPSTNANEFNIELSNCLRHNPEVSDLHVIIGDINIDILHVDTNGEDYLNILSGEGFESMINKPTRVQGETARCIDHIFVRKQNNLDCKFMPAIIQSDITDHYTTVIQVAFPGTHKRNLTTHETRLYVDKMRLVSQVESERWQEVYNAGDVNTAAQIFVDKLKSYVENNTINVKINKIKKNSLDHSCSYEGYSN